MSREIAAKKQAKTVILSFHRSDPRVKATEFFTVFR